MRPEIVKNYFTFLPKIIVTESQQIVAEHLYIKS